MWCRGHLEAGRGPADIQARIVDYFSAGTRLVWVLEPSARSVRAYRSPEDMLVIREGGEISGATCCLGFAAR